MSLPDWMAVFPGHFEGPCGKGMCGRPSTTIGFERLFNPIASLEHDAFVSELVEGAPARPLNMVAIEATNRGTVDMAWAMLTSDDRVPEIPAAEIAIADGALIDVREPLEYAAGHARGTINIPQAEIASRIDELPRDRPIYVICQSGMRSLKTTRFLQQAGFSQAINVPGGTEDWQAAGLPMA